jgi:L-threonylcarbamoyladenylate synthase
MLEPTTDSGRAVRSIRRGGLVAIPTETVYGLAADATNPAAVRRIFEIKARPTSHPLIVHIADISDIDRWAIDVPDDALRLAGLAWPGPLTIIVTRRPGVLDEVTGGRDSVGVRVPAHPMTLELITRSGTALAAPSANRFGAVSPTTAGHVVDDLGEYLDPDLDVILDGGPCPVGVESTIIDFLPDVPQVLRAGGISTEQIELLLRRDLAAAAGPARASGMLESHYSPRCPVLLCSSPSEAAALQARSPGSVVLDMTDDLALYARSLYAELRRADSSSAAAVIAVMPPPTGLGHAIRDRLTKAAAPRPTR